MALKIRRIISLIFILLFFAITPAILLYAAGFKLSKNGLFIQKTGLLIIDSRPRGAKIFINGRVQKNFIGSWFKKDSFITTPAKIKNLLPGEYQLALELKGYWGWQKKLIINPGSATSAEDIYLFRNDLPIQIAPAESRSINLSADKNQALIFSAGQIIFYRLADETKKSILQNNLKGNNIAWSNDGEKLMIDNYLFDLNNLNYKVDLNKLVASPFNFKWSNNNLFFQDKTSIYRLANSNSSEKIIGGRQFNDYLVKNGYLYLINEVKPAARLEIIDLALKKPIKEINLPASSNYSFINSEQPLINLYDRNRKILYLIDPLAVYYSPLVEIINNVKTTFWLDANNLLYANDYEIWFYNLETKNKNLITRLSETINQAISLPSKNYFIYSTNQTIKAIELDERGKRNITELAKFDLISSFILNHQGTILYFSGQIGQTEGLYKLLIQ